MEYTWDTTQFLDLYGDLMESIIEFSRDEPNQLIWK